MNKKNDFSKEELIKFYYKCDTDKINFIIKYNERNNIKYNFTNDEIFNIIFNSCKKKSLLTTRLLLYQEKDFDVLQNNNFLIRELSKLDNEDFIKWFHKEYPSIDFNSNNHEAFFNACYSDNVSVISYIYENCNNKLNIHRNNDELIRNVSKNSNKKAFILLNYYTTFNIEIDPKFNDVNKFEKIFFFLCRYNYIDLAKLYYQKNNFNINDSNGEAICLAVQENHLELAKWLYSVGADIRIQDNWCFKIALSKGKFEILEWIISLNIIDLNYDHENLFRYACLYSPIESVKWLYGKTTIDIHARGDEPFISCCVNNKCDVVEWLYDIGTFDLSFNNNILFKYMIEFGNTYIAKWIFNRTQINLHEDDEFIFRLACNRNNIDLAKWIFSLGNVNIKACSNQSFKLACQFNYVELADWLQKLNPLEYDIIIQDNTIIEWNIKKVITVSSSKYVDEIFDCPICYSKKSELITNCNHMYCMDCFKSFAESRTESVEDLECPMCRSKNMSFFKVKKK